MRNEVFPSIRVIGFLYSYNIVKQIKDQYNARNESFGMRRRGKMTPKMSLPQAILGGGHALGDPRTGRKKMK